MALHSAPDWAKPEVGRRRDTPLRECFCKQIDWQTHVKAALPTGPRKRQMYLWSQLQIEHLNIIRSELNPSVTQYMKEKAWMNEGSQNASL